MHIKNQIIAVSQLLIVFFLFSMVFSIAPLLVFSQGGTQYSSEGKLSDSDLIKKTNIEYDASNFRDPLHPQIFLRQEKEHEVEENVEISKPKASELFSLSVQGIIWDSDTAVAIINNKVIKKGEALLISKDGGVTEEVTILDIAKDGITIIYLGEVEKLSPPANLGLQEMKGR